MDQLRPRAPVPPLDPRAVVIMRKLAGEFADRYASEYLLGQFRKILSLPDTTKESATVALENPYSALVLFFAHYAFSRRGKDREELADFAVEATKQIVAEKSMQELLALPDGAVLWHKFDEICQLKKKKSNEQQNRGVLQGMLELAQEIHRLDADLSLATWVVEGVKATGKLEPQHLRIVDIRGVGPKSASTFLRDMVWLYGIEDQIEPADRLFVQPVDRWLRLIVKYVVPEPDLEDPADWIVAGKISKYVRRANVSGVAFNMGTNFFGQRTVGDPDRFEDHLRSLLVSEIAETRFESGSMQGSDRQELD